MTASDPTASDTTMLLAKYLETALRWDELQSDAGAANAEFTENHRLYKILRGTHGGRDGIEGLMTHPNVAVRLTAATHSLAWAPEAATSTLEAIQSGFGQRAVSAKYTLLSFRAGELNLDW